MSSIARIAGKADLPLEADKADYMKIDASTDVTEVNGDSKFILARYARNLEEKGSRLAGSNPVVFSTLEPCLHGTTTQ
jgi:hypothetical protein